MHEIIIIIIIIIISDFVHEIIQFGDSCEVIRHGAFQDMTYYFLLNTSHKKSYVNIIIIIFYFTNVYLSVYSRE